MKENKTSMDKWKDYKVKEYFETMPHFPQFLTRQPTSFNNAMDVQELIATYIQFLLEIGESQKNIVKLMDDFIGDMYEFLTGQQIVDVLKITLQELYDDGWLGDVFNEMWGDDFLAWWNDIKSVVENIDQGGNIEEIIKFRYSKEFDTLFPRMSDRGDFWDKKIIDLENKVIKNKWLTDLNGKYIAHKGYNGLKYDGSVGEHVYPDNTLKSYEAAGNLGFKAIEIDIVKCLDGFVVHHEEDTSLMSGEKKDFDKMTVAEIKERFITKEYIGGGTYLTLTGVDENYKVPTLKEVFEIAKKYGMYVVCDVKWMIRYKYTDDDIKEITDIAKETGMEQFTIWYGNSNFKICDILKNSILAVASIDANHVEESVNRMKQYNNYVLSVDEKDYMRYAEYSRYFDIPLFVWTVDEYFKANTIFKNSVNAILTNRLISNGNIKDLQQYNIVESEYFRRNGTNGTYRLTNGVHYFETETYLGRYFRIDKGKLNKGDVIKVVASGRTITSNATSAFCRINIDNGLSGNKLIRSLAFFETNSFEEKEVYYVVNDVKDDIAINFGMGSGGFSGNGSGEIKDITIEVFTNNDFSSEAFGYITAYNGLIQLRGGFMSKGITEVTKKVTGSGEPAILEIKYDTKRFHSLKEVAFVSRDSYSNRNTVQPIAMNDEYKSTPSVVGVKFMKLDGTFITDLNELQMGFTIQVK